MTEGANKDCVQRHFEQLWNRGEVERIDEFFSTEFSNFGVPYSDVRGMIQQIIRTWRCAFPDLAFQIDSLVGEGDTVMCEVTLSGTHLGDFPMITPLHGPTLAPNGRRFAVKHIHRFRLKEAKIVEHFAVRDDLCMFQQLGHLGALGPSHG
ncbi:MAG: ester cyclase [Terracidiphilus sp.]